MKIKEIEKTKRTVKRMERCKEKINNIRNKNNEKLRKAVRFKLVALLLLFLCYVLYLEINAIAPNEAYVTEMFFALFVFIGYLCCKDFLVHVNCNNRIKKINAQLYQVLSKPNTKVFSGNADALFEEIEELQVSGQLHTISAETIKEVISMREKALPKDIDSLIAQSRHKEEFIANYNSNNVIINN